MHRFYPLVLVLLVGAWLQGCGTSQRDRGGVSRLPARDQRTIRATPRPASRNATMPLRPGTRHETVRVAPQTQGRASDPFTTARTNWLPLDYWASSQTLGNVNPVSASQFHLATHWGVFGFAERSLYAVFNGWRFHLGYPLRITNGVPYLHRLDAEKNLRPLITSYERLPRGNGIICIDPGHGGKHTGTRSTLGKFFEKDYSLDWALKLRPQLEQRGWRVVLTRTDDTTMSLTDRVKIADRVQASLFVSLHFNAAGSGATGLETYCTTPRGMPSTLKRGYSDPMGASMPNNAYDARNLHLAARVHSSLLRHVKMADRGIRRARFMTVIAQQKRPAVLIEGGYLSDPAEARNIGTGNYRLKLAEAVAMALQ